MLDGDTIIAIFNTGNPPATLSIPIERIYIPTTADSLA